MTAGIGGSTTNAYFPGDANNPVKEGVHGTANDLAVVSGSHGNTAATIARYNLNGSLIGTIPLNLSGYNGGNIGIGNVLVTNDGKYMYAPLETASYVIKLDLANGNIVRSFRFTGTRDVAIDLNGNMYAANHSNGSPALFCWIHT